MAGWKTITDDKEKYAAYLCSREWAVKREAVRERAEGICERCDVLDMDACHHLTYERKYDEKLEDLQAICNSCHEFTHGKSDFDPRAQPVDTNIRVYMAGKVSANDWRHAFVDDLHEYDYDKPIQPPGVPFHLRVNDRVFVLYYTGPFFKALGGHGMGHGENSHGCGIEREIYRHDGDIENRRQVYLSCSMGIRRSNIFIAWIDSGDCYGTIFETGLARRSDIQTVIGFHRNSFRYSEDMWLMSEFATVYGNRKSPEEFVCRTLGNECRSFLKGHARKSNGKKPT